LFTWQQRHPQQNWLQDPNNALGISVELESLRARLRAMIDAELTAFGKQMHELVYPLTYDGAGKQAMRIGVFRFNSMKPAWNGVSVIQVTKRKF
jgi:hypothetical protein